MIIVVMVFIIATVGSVLIAGVTYMVDKNADRRDHMQDR